MSLVYQTRTTENPKTNTKIVGVKAVGEDLKILRVEGNYEIWGAFLNGVLKGERKRRRKYSNSNRSIA